MFVFICIQSSLFADKIETQTCSDYSVGRQFAQVAVFPVVDVFASSVVAQKFVVVTAAIPRPLSIVTSISVLSHCCMPHERNVATDCQPNTMLLLTISTMQQLNYSKVGGGTLNCAVFMWSWSQWLNSGGTPARCGGTAFRPNLTTGTMTIKKILSPVSTIMYHTDCNAHAKLYFNIHC